MTSAQASTADTAADAFLARLATRGVEYLFANGGTDFAPLAEARAKGLATGARMPEPVLVPHENLGVAMMHGYAMLTGRPQAMMVHVGVGTANALNGIINASRQNVRMLLCAGRSSLTRSPIDDGGARPRRPRVPLPEPSPHPAHLAKSARLWYCAKASLRCWRARGAVSTNPIGGMHEQAIVPDAWRDVHRGVGRARLRRQRRGAAAG